MTTTTYTFVAEYKGGTYVSQVQATNIIGAAMAWGQQTAQSDDIPLKNKTLFVETLREDLAEVPPACLEGTPNAWYFLADAGKGYVHVNVVKTHAAVTDWQPRPASALTAEAMPGAAAAA